VSELVILRLRRYTTDLQSPALKTEADFSSETLLQFYRNTRRHFPQCVIFTSAWYSGNSRLTFGCSESTVYVARPSYTRRHAAWNWATDSFHIPSHLLFTSFPVIQCMDVTRTSESVVKQINQPRNFVVKRSAKT